MKVSTIVTVSFASACAAVPHLGSLGSSARNLAGSALAAAKAVPIPAAVTSATDKVSAAFAEGGVSGAATQARWLPVFYGVGAKCAAYNPGTAAACAALAVGAVCVAQPVAVAAPVLNAVGFGSSGIVSGSAAAGIQSTLGSVVAPSAFSTLQSAAMGGYGVAAVTGMVQAAGAAVGSSAGAVLAWAKLRT
ncbi:hypothetical protein SPI_01119 [Niveomyces insectorum RCEF 264]|uniref:Interferon-induced 6-16 n=1 Tax=Niveomyces insectorum RCEF 264 TaxID=1081102 RepID=A0A167YPI0_9HYPO|nr:hypothetical protein SPI_01119 [Niveomyces insectorum RCEF 264]